MGCSSSTTTQGQSENNITATGCKIFNTQTGKLMTPAELAKLNDPLALKVLEGTDCPQGYSEIVKKLKTTDTQNCADVAGQPAAGMQSFMIDELAAFSDAQAFRTVVTRTCDGRQQNDLLFSGFASANAVGEGIEVIGKDKTSGIFNFYEVDGNGGWTFFGNSLDFIGNGYDCQANGSCISNNTKITGDDPRDNGKRCATCHVGGGLLMKELDTPWVHWTAGSPIGADKVQQKNKDLLGSLNGGASLELSVIRPSMGPYADKRVEFLASKGVEELMRPLFCTMDINLDSAFPPRSNLVVDRLLILGSDNLDENGLHGNKGPSVGPFDLKATYDELKTEVKQRIQARGRQVTDRTGKAVDDTAIAFTYPERATLDMAHVLALKRAKLIDDEFISDVLNVDFTRSIFSGQRCSLVGLVKGAPNLAALDKQLADWSKASPNDRASLQTDIVVGILAIYQSQLEAKASRTPAEEQLLKNLKAEGSRIAQKKAASDFVAKCTARLSSTDKAEKKAALKDIMTYASSVRLNTREHQGFNGQRLIETEQMMVVDNIPRTDLALDPDDCKLILRSDQVRAK